MDKNPEIRVRMAPSPTGYLHIGSARTTLFNWLYARSLGGIFVLRIEDTDAERSKKEFEDDIIGGLKWLGLDWDEFYRQTERTDIYEKSLRKLLDSGKAFWCYHSQEELEAEKKSQIEKGDPQRHVCEHKKSSTGNGALGKGIIRLAVDENSIRKINFEDEIRGSIAQEERLLGDFSIAKDLKNPLYNFAVVVDDVDMKISHVIRGEDHISNTFKQILIYEALEENVPKFAHLPLILGTDRSKMSKRNSNTALDEYKKDYLPEAIMNFIAFLGYTYSKEIMSMDEMLKEFDLKKIHKSGAVWNVEKLDWINAQYVRQMEPEKFKEIVGIKEMPLAAVPFVTERLDKLTDVINYSYFWETPVYNKDLLKWKKATLEESIEALRKVRDIIDHQEFTDKEALRLGLDDLAKISGGDRGLIYWPLRAALSGKEKSPDPIEIAFVLGKEESLKRIDEATKILP
ncbi:MAG: glutamate--tRNA ligase [Candidatus Yanofskybacteria bacterium RIFOXYD1_FULL_44_17]|uniref:Glutamate--tRNA ligase n=1 Tax=Candidatus Yanofskybacteria bacterium GW2011_GWE2_40_11 TaxID=1619033 RepID=A0A0G0TTM0_9BACT|nr:MAG: Glutamate-tRNA ligase [Candidatus Yanofskybacteria bacterium GW2011_GWE2_40_11]OGN36170.1 MAG: glutamate--tRNA ligase [Candidatus Yanofskybacteria bacterium RIFOXYA2_FULL_45_28]OGN36886.1 MAG: glutamate--tRNA ligase [Candidatus Yanofskybacteria bacterium RIFOXYA1_FULL_44_17]OGN38329.1 MAG: glutamate--tRNA ligase [Candidatus Yanofskybacteria bacterium RIFOXYC1_FULL_44_16]OGN38507.1 MAG: glutamate--tRNA ligase [Candidatus Yanofskybacteria bacterium RIFOXYB2_FULL_44_18]OGN38686.1 MAG: glu